MKGVSKIEDEDEFIKSPRGSGTTILFVVIGNIIFWGTAIVVTIMILKHKNII
jgi:hypothetical protein